MDIAVFYGVLLFSTMFAIAWLIRERPKNYVTPSKALPAAIASLLPRANEKAFIGSSPWSTTVPREALACRTEHCKGRAYIKVLEPSRNTWAMSTQKDMRTGWPVDYPVATVVVIPERSKTKYILDTGLVPLIEADNSLLNMGPFWWDPDATAEGRNLTGDFVHSFVVHNASSETVLFGRRAVQSNNTDYWALRPGTWTLLWPLDRYWANSTDLTVWNAADLPKESMSAPLAASLAETMMYSVLRPEAPAV